MPSPLLAEWGGPYGGVPPFDKVRVGDFRSALDRAMARNMAEINAISVDPALPTFENTIVAMERSGRAFGRVQALFGVWTSTMSTPELERVEAEEAPRIAAFNDQIGQNPKLFARIAAVATALEKDNLPPENRALIEVYHRGLVRDGAALDPDDKARFMAIGQELADLYARFSSNLRADEDAHALALDSIADLGDMPKPLVDQAAAEAARRGLSGKWVIAPTRAAMEPFLASCPRRALRAQAWRLWGGRGDRGDEHDNNKLVASILRLRGERAKMLGHPTCAHERLEGTMAKTPDGALAMCLSIWKAAVARLNRDVAEMQARVDRERGGFTIAPWDVRYYGAKLRRSEGSDSPHAFLQLDRVREAMFATAGRLFGCGFAEVHDVPVAHRDIRVWEVKARDGAHLGLWYFDAFARPGKQPGAWTNGYRAQEKFEKPVPPIVSLNANLAPPAPAQPALVSWGDAQSLFHEFGHALHALSSDVSYPSLAGDAVARDVLEFPSELNTRWLRTPEMLRMLDATGAAAPGADDALATVEELASAIVDLKLHLAGEGATDPKAFEASTLEQLGMPAVATPRHRTVQFDLVFGGEGDAANYYAFVWADALAADAWSAFTEAGGPWDATVAERLRNHMLSVGASVDPATAWRNFRGRALSPDPLIKERGFI